VDGDPAAASKPRADGGFHVGRAKREPHAQAWTPDAFSHQARFRALAREAVVWKLDGLSEYDIRRPLTPSGTNLLGLVKHLATVELGYFGPTFGRPHHESLPWHREESEPNSDMWAPADESREDVLGLHHRAWAHADATIEALPLDAMGPVAWWGDDGHVTLQRIMLHMTA
jgi:Protein of unknown function (DUF664)